MSANGSTGPTPHDLLTARVEKLEHDLEQVIWLHAELMYALRLAAARQVVQSPQVQQQMVEQIMSGAQ